MTIKKLLKKIFVFMVWLVSELPTPRGLKDFICTQLIPYVLDPDILPHKLTPKPLRGFRYPILCDPHLYVHRMPYFFGELYEVHLQNYIKEHIRMGDTIIDVGCNAGHMAITAAEFVGPNGRVIAFEPNEALANAVQGHAASLGLSQVRIYPFALGRENRQMRMERQGEHTGGATLCKDRFDKGASDVTSFDVAVRRGDHVFEKMDMSGRVFLKIDVEGFEQEVLDGMPTLLAHRINHAVVEVTPEWIGGTAGVDRLFKTMKQYGFQPFMLLGNGNVGRQLLPAQINSQTDVLFKKDRE